MVNTERAHQLMQARGMDISGLARTSGLSRQGVYRLLSKDYHPLGRGLQAMAAALGVSPLTLLADSADDAGGAEILQLVAQAAQGEPRAFELLPASLHQATPAALSRLEPLSPLQHQLLAAAVALGGFFAQRTTVRLRKIHLAPCRERFLLVLATKKRAKLESEHAAANHTRWTEGAESACPILCTGVERALPR